MALSLVSLHVLLLFRFGDVESVLSAPTSPSPDFKDSTQKAVMTAFAHCVWNANFSCDSETIEICKQYMANLEPQSSYASGDCCVKHCSFDPRCFPAVMIFDATCSCDKADENILLQVLYLFLKCAFMYFVEKYILPRVNTLLKYVLGILNNYWNQVANTE